MEPLRPGTLCWLIRPSDRNEVSAGTVVEVLTPLGDLVRTVRDGDKFLTQVVRDAYEVRSRDGVVMLAARRVLRPIADSEGDGSEAVVKVEVAA